MIKLKLSPETVGAVHTHTHTHMYFLQTLWEGRRKLIYNFFQKWSKGGSREQLEVSRLPRDLIG